MRSVRTMRGRFDLVARAGCRYRTMAGLQANLVDGRALCRHAAGDRFYIESQDRTVRAQLECRTCPACKMSETIDTQDPNATLKIRDLPVLP